MKINFCRATLFLLQGKIFNGSASARSNLISISNWRSAFIIGCHRCWHATFFNNRLLEYCGIKANTNFAYLVSYVCRLKKEEAKININPQLHFGQNVTNWVCQTPLCFNYYKRIYECKMYKQSNPKFRIQCNKNEKNRQKICVWKNYVYI